MRIGSLYIRILKHWLAALVVTEALVFALFVLVIGDSHRQYVTRSVGQSAQVAADFVAASLKGEADSQSRLEETLKRLSATANARAWVTGTDGVLLAASFPGEEPSISAGRGKKDEHGGVLVVTDLGDGVPWYAVAPVPVNGRDFRLHLLSQQTSAAFPAGRFAAGLALVGIFVAVLAVPLTLRITRPLKRLQESALRIAGGDLSARAAVSGRDEIGRLAAAFNSMAETVERMVRGGKELTANVSHELRSPLARIRVAAECLREAVARGDRAETGEMLEAIAEDVDEADRMIGRILEYSRLDLQEPMAMTETAPAEPIRALAKALGPQARAKGIAVSLDLLDGELVKGDQESLRALFKNLLENAVRHTAPGGKVQVTMRRDGEALLVEIANTHAPLEPRELELIFNPFYRGKGAAGEGTGLGLAIAKKICALHKGDITARNDQGGFLVTVSLPAAPSPSP